MEIKFEEIEYTNYARKRGKTLHDTVQNFHKLERALSYIEIDKGTILPVKPCVGYKWGLGGVVDKNNVFVTESIHPGFGNDEDIRFGGMYSAKDDKIQQIDECVIYCDPIITQWGHFLVDSITRLWYAIQNPNIKVAFCGYGFTPNILGSPYMDFLKYLGIPKENLIDVRNVTQFRKIIIPEMSYIADSYYSREYLDLFEKVVENIKKQYIGKCKAMDKIYFTRCQFKENNIRYREMGEKELEEIFRYNDYTIIAPEQYSFEEQIILYSGCKNFASLSGTIAHNVLFTCSLENLFILNKTSHIQRQQYYLNHIKNVRDINIDVFREPLIKYGIPIDTGAGPYILGYTKYFSMWMKDMEFVAPHSFNYYRLKWLRNYIWLITILPVRRIKAMYGTIMRGMKKIRKISGVLGMRPE